ncbi:MAG TPA: hypothetical protein VGA55_00990 [Bacteroidota bacterium]
MTLLSKNVLVLFLLLFSLLHHGLSQEGTWSLSVSGGPAFPVLTDVNKTLDGTVSEWNQKDVPIGFIEHFSTVLQFSVRGMYRFERDLGISLVVSQFDQSVSGIYKDSQVSLDLDRSVGATEIALGFSYVLPPVFYSTEIFINLDAGFFLAHAGANTVHIAKHKFGRTDIDSVHLETDAQYSKSGVSAGIGGVIVVYAVGPVFLKADAVYRIAEIGRMPGTVRRLEGTIEEESVSRFDFSGLSASLGIGITF